ncbi:unnamed protein product [Adineta steineri]|uniref:NAD(P)(+)--arginine ADP-ribosyltransferase n=1 Tax=Adineta steineri TaxID=433720 RepID=A0A815UYP1_9BILA|nr:unnamed protein product [Adineta steineri]CAF1527351.1 unnamed protein product [Adineta steineri]CAF1527674.1 unnamed protein product [Adineta steineri]
MLAEFRAYYQHNHHELLAIDDFERTYRSGDAIRWYTKPCFLFRLINKALRTEDICAFYTFRYFIIDLCTQLEEAVGKTASCAKIFRVYRGSRLSRDEVEQLQVGMLVTANGFLSSSRDLNVAQQFISIDPVTGLSPSRSRMDKRQYVLFEIDVDLIHSPYTTAVDVTRHSTMPHEDEVIFNLGTTFTITDINYDTEHYLWHIQILSSSEVAELSRAYNMFVRKRLNEVNGILMCGHYLTEIYSNYTEAMRYFHHLLRSKTVDDNDRPAIYYHLGRAYRFMGKYQQAITYFKCAQLFQRRKLPQSSFDYGRTLRGLSNVYSDMEDTTRALYFEEKAIAIHRKCLPDDHIEISFHLNRLAFIHWQQKQYERALIFVENALLYFKQKMPTDYPAEARSLHVMGLIQHSLGNRQQALDFFKKALHMRESLLADDHPFVAQTCHELSILCAEQDDEYAMALEYAQRALNIRKKKLSPNHIDVKRSIELFERLSQRHDAT